MYFLFAKKEELSPINKQCNEEFNGFGPRILFYGEEKKLSETKRGKKDFFAWEVVLGERQECLGFLSKVFVKCINQREFVRLGLMLQNIKKKRRIKKNREVAFCNVKRECTRVCRIRENKRNCSEH